ncbi:MULTISPECIES: site-specific integrase [unclassified Aurantimonas]|uniref:site-specific integrase n=1 Tax=unclassified Aurantimonas TaxID=2638230 RepID=UPI002E18C107|nr:MULTISPECIES: site-specific integrase [unclassified Aurantimonas]MEC5292105.1 site-specific integrase [Aurantimonas sp. C2-3-R2]MEC5413191.1 site-specific integrase [Aurantimonas sp. C2-4-R8]
MATPVTHLVDRRAIDCTDDVIPRAINCTGDITNFSDLSPAVADLVDGSLSANSKRAYQSDLDHFIAWGGMIPASAEMIAAYLATHADVLTPATLTRRLASLSKAHALKRVSSPTTDALVKATLRGIRRRNGSAQRQAKPLLRDDLFAVLGAMGDRPKDIRDRALLLIGFAGGFRRSELVGLDVTDVEMVRQGLVVTLRRSKTDQAGAGRKIGIPHGRTRWCPVTALEAWLSASGIEAGPIFRGMTRHGCIRDQRLTGEAVSIIVKERLAAAGFDHEGYSGHSLRAGFATSAAQAGASSWKIRQQTGHASDAILSRYIRVGQLFTDNAAGAVL